MNLNLLSATLLSFFLGSLPFGWMIAKLWGVPDLRSEGSKNIGATNVVRTAGWVPGALTFLLDFAKGAVPTYFFSCVGAQLCDQTTGLQGFAAILGHCFSPFLYFRGGKGVSTILGMMVVLDPVIGAVAIGTYILGLAFFRVSALGSLFAMLTLLCGELLFGKVLAEKVLVIAAVLLILHRHRVNWDQLLKAAAVVALVLAGILGEGVGGGQQAQASGVTTKTVQDFRGKRVSVPDSPVRVVALMPALAEAVFEMDRGASVAAVPDYTNIPAAFAGKVKNIGPYPRLSAEMIHSLKPDLVLASMDGNESAVIEKLEALGAPVMVMNTTSLEEISKTLKTLAEIFGTQKNAKLVLFEKIFSKASENQHVSASAKKVFFQIGWDPLITVGKNTYLNDLITKAGGQNIFAESGLKYPRPNAEAVLKENPDIIVICQLTKDGQEEIRAQNFWKRFPTLKAVQQNKVLILPGDSLTKPGFALIDGLALLKKSLGAQL